MTSHEKDPVPGFPAVDEETANATRTMFGAMLRWMLVLLAVLLVGGTTIGWLTAGMAGVWAALIGSGIAAAFLLTTVVLGIVTADKPTWVASSAILGGWLVKMALLFATLIALRGHDFYNRYVLFGVVTVAILGFTAIEVREALRARVPYTAPRGGSATAPESGPEA